MLPYIAEFLGTMILIILGDGVVANVNLNKSGMKGGGTVHRRKFCVVYGSGVYCSTVCGSICGRRGCISSVQRTV